MLLWVNHRDEIRMEGMGLYPFLSFLSCITYKTA
nr:MAG TPA: hypothetical protein [Caudoviricetes sp.]